MTLHEDEGQSREERRTAATLVKNSLIRMSLEPRVCFSSMRHQPWIVMLSRPDARRWLSAAPGLILAPTVLAYA
jgi:hypothetical protein